MSPNGTYTEIANISSVNTTNHKDIGLTPGITYYYKMRAYLTINGQKIYSNYSDVKTIKLVMTRPTINAQVVTYDSITISWNKIAGVSGYAVYRATSQNGVYTETKNISSVNTTSYKDVGLATGTMYYYKMRTYITVGGQKIYSNYSDVKTAKPILARPTVKAKTVTYNSITVSWDKIVGASGYIVYRATSQNGKYSVVKTIQSGHTVSYKNTKLKTGQKYYYKVIAYRTVNSKKIYSEYSLIKTIIPAPIAPKMKNVKKSGAKALKLNWGKVAGASGYEIFVSTSKNGKYKKITTITKGKIVTYTNGKLKSKKTYYYKMRAYTKVKNKKVYGGYSKIISQKVK